MEARHARTYASGGLAVGMLLLLVGTGFLLLNLGLLRSDILRVWWPLLPILIGGLKLFHRGWQYRLRKPYSDFA